MDSLTGGTGADTFAFPMAGHLAGAIDGGLGTNALDYSGRSTAVVVNLKTGAATSVTGGVTNIANATTGGGNDTLTGNGLNNQFTGGAGNDTYVFDTDTQLGSDGITETGGGVDTLDFSGTTTLGVTVDLATGVFQTVNANLKLALHSGVTIKNAIGTSQADRFTGNSLNNQFTGGAGDDVYVFDMDTQLGSDGITDTTGVDTLDFSGTATLGATLTLATGVFQTVNANLKLALHSGVTIENVIGTSQADTITGNTLNNVLVGGAGNDILSGGAGADILIGGTGADTLTGGTGEDLLLGASFTKQATVAAIDALMAEWGRTDLAYSGRINHLTGATSGGNNGTFLLTTTGVTPTVTEDAATDTMTGGADALDWFIRHSGTNADAITDLNAGGTETVTSV